jgi:ectoine hydroxylase-related dioxygenase (phytanoyl-CoA dioxygenase family)
MTVPITEEEVRAFHDRGYLILRDVFDPDELAAMRSEADRILELLINASLATDRTSDRLQIADTNRGQVVKKVQPVSDLSLRIGRVGYDERFLGPVRTLLGDEPILLEEKLNYKQPLPEPVAELDATVATDAFPVHNDWAHYRIDGYPRSLIWAAVALDDCPSRRGPIHVWPGSHVRHRPHEGADDELEIPPDEINHNGGTDLDVSAGSVMLFHSLLVHNSAPNRSGRPRRLLLYSHYPDSEYDAYFDRRNGPVRYRESQWEAEYRRRKRTGEFEDRFTLRSGE